VDGFGGYVGLLGDCHSVDGGDGGDVVLVAGVAEGEGGGVWVDGGCMGGRVL